jgi:hypothetical protein
MHATIRTQSVNARVPGEVPSQSLQHIG